MQHVLVGQLDGVFEKYDGVPVRIICGFFYVHKPAGGNAAEMDLRHLNQILALCTSVSEML